MNKQFRVYFEFDDDSHMEIVYSPNLDSAVIDAVTKMHEDMPNQTTAALHQAIYLVERIRS